MPETSYKSPTNYVKCKLNNLIFFDFCRTFIDKFDNVDAAKSTLKKTLQGLANSKTNDQDTINQAQDLLNEFETLTSGTNERKLFSYKDLKDATELRVLEESQFGQNTLTKFFRNENDRFNFFNDDDDLSTLSEEKLSISQAVQSSKKSNTTEIGLISSDSDDLDYSAVTSVKSKSTIKASAPPPVLKQYLISTNASDLIDIDNIDNKWISSNNLDFSTPFVISRNNIVSKSTTGTILTQDEELALSGILYANQDHHSNVLDDDLYEPICATLKQTYSTYEEEENEAIDMLVFKFSKLMSKGDFTNAATIIEDSTLPPYIKAILLSLQRTYSPGFNLTTLNESTIVKDGVVPFLENFFPNTKKYCTHGADKQIPESSNRFTQMDPSLSSHVKKADYSILSTRSGHLVFALEAKSNHTKKNSAGDLVKMARYMKDIIDTTEDEGFNNVKICGMISSGPACSLYVMEHRYDYIYTFYQLGSFYLALDYTDMARINSIFPLLHQLKNIVHESVNELSKLNHERETELKKLKTYHTPTELPEQRVKKTDLTTPAATAARRSLRFKR